jgi:beta-glucanase (GH16 family)
MLPTDWVYGGWAASGEIDIMEAVNLETQSDADGATLGMPEHRVHGTLHYGQAWPNNQYSGTYYDFGPDESPADDFHHYAIEWQSGEIRWYVDGHHYATQTDAGWFSQYPDPNTDELVTGSGTAPFNKRFHLILNLAVGGDWPANVNDGGIDPTVFPQTMKVDYVRVYQCDVDAVTGAGCATRSADADDVVGHQP